MDNLIANALLSATQRKPKQRVNLTNLANAETYIIIEDIPQYGVLVCEMNFIQTRNEVIRLIVDTHIENDFEVLHIHAADGMCENVTEDIIRECVAINKANGHDAYDALRMAAERYNIEAMPIQAREYLNQPIDAL